MSKSIIIPLLTPLLLVPCHAGSQHGQKDVSADSIPVKMVETCEIMSEVEKKCLNGMIPLSELNAGLSIVKVTHPNGKSASIKVLRKSPLKQIIQ